VPTKFSSFHPKKVKTREHISALSLDEFIPARVSICLSIILNNI